MDTKQSNRQLAIAIYTVNRHAKTAPDNKHLYTLKKMALDKLLNLGSAEKIGLHFVDNPKFSKQHSTLLIRCDDFLFHSIPEKEDFDTLPHLGQQDQTSRNPQERMSLKSARELLSNFVGPLPCKVLKKKQSIPKKNMHNVQMNHQFRSSYLDGK
ncbi:YkyB family protein [Sporosarcina limicola]|uniref:YkyB-like protein n=1 Tax=Sporosarcina limicola TaxID=34101 RepID=A0A927RDF8_9BACL|nr:YkyB family protein [Sporosarcina limicola]MBE1553637.1 hypothetical protein [Sporosarcina limicola]